MRCFEAGALATGCDLAVTPLAPDYAELRPDASMLGLYRANAEALGRVFPDPTGGPRPARPPTWATSPMPCQHPPMLGLDCLPAVNHQPEFTAACATPAADRAVLDGATAMAWTAVDLARASSAQRAARD